MVRMGVIGAGAWGKNHLRLLSAAPFSLAGLADVDAAMERLAAEKDVAFETDYRRLFPAVDALVIATPASTHYAVALACLNAGKHVLVEKPLCLDLSRARRLADVAARAKLVLATGHLYRFNPAVIVVKDKLREIGQIRQISMRYLNAKRKPPADCNIFFDLGSHLFDLLAFFTVDPPVKIRCERLTPPSRATPGGASITVGYGAFEALLEVSWAHTDKQRDAWFTGSLGSLYADFLGQTLVQYSSADPGRGTPLAIEKNEPLKAELLHFVECIEQGKTPVNSGRQNLPVIGLCESATRAGDTGREVYL